MARLSITVSCLLLLAAGCSRTGRLVEPATPDLRGTWEESYTLEVIGVGIPEEPDSGVDEIDLVSRISFGEQTFRITTFRIENSGDISGSDFFGLYSQSGDTLTFLLDIPGSSSQPDPCRFRYVIEADRLMLSELPVDMGNGMYAVSLRSLPWQYPDPSYLVIGSKRSGTFERASN